MDSLESDSPILLYPSRTVVGFCFSIFGSASRLGIFCPMILFGCLGVQSTGTFNWLRISSQNNVETISLFLMTYNHQPKGVGLCQHVAFEIRLHQKNPKKTYLGDTGKVLL